MPVGRTSKPKESKGDGKKTREVFFTKEIKTLVAQAYRSPLVQEILKGTAPTFAETKTRGTPDLGRGQRYGNQRRASWIILTRVCPFEKGATESEEAFLARQEEYRKTGELSLARCPDWDEEQWAREQHRIGSLEAVSVLDLLANIV